MRYYYIHGAFATGKTTAKLLSEVLDSEIEILSWDISKKFNENFNSMSEIIEKSDDDEIILIGKSIGGFYANQLTNKFLIPCALFNPVINAKEILTKFGVNPEIANSYDVELKDEIVPRLVVVGLKDEILNPDVAIKKWEGKCLLIKVDAEHDIKDFKQYREKA